MKFIMTIEDVSKVAVEVSVNKVARLEERGEETTALQLTAFLQAAADVWLETHYMQPDEAYQFLQSLVADAPLH